MTAVLHTGGKEKGEGKSFVVSTYHVPEAVQGTFIPTVSWRFMSAPFYR